MLRMHNSTAVTYHLIQDAPPQDDQSRQGQDRPPKTLSPHMLLKYEALLAGIQICIKK